MDFTQRPALRLSQIWNMSVGFLGIQFGFALQNANASRILQTFGADVEHLSWFWLAAPVTGMIIQPIIGYYSDRTWTRLGRRKPYFLAGAVLTALALVLLPNAGKLAFLIPPMFIGAGILMLLDASINVAMEPFRALIGDLLPDRQRTLGFSIQTFLIGIGAVVGSWLPYIFAEWLHIGKETPAGGVPDNLTYAFYVGAAVLLCAILWTIVTTREYPPDPSHTDSSKSEASGKRRGIAQIADDLRRMPKAMLQLGVVQFFSWFALFSMWVYTTPAVARQLYGTVDPHSIEYQTAGNWVGLLFGVYNGVATVFALCIPAIARKLGRKKTHALALLCGALGLLLFPYCSSANALILPMVGIGIAWASILAMPYAMLSHTIPVAKMGIYMGLFNFFITLPQIINGIFNGPLVKWLYNGNTIYAITTAGGFMAVAALSVLFIKGVEANEQGN